MNHFDVLEEMYIYSLAIGACSRSFTFSSIVCHKCKRQRVVDRLVCPGLALPDGMCAGVDMPGEDLAQDAERLGIDPRRLRGAAIPLRPSEEGIGKDAVAIVQVDAALASPPPLF